MKNFYNKGITVMELLVIIAVIGVMVVVTIPQFSKMKENQVLKSGVQDILSSIDKARVATISSLDASEYGIHFQSDRIIIFKGTVFSAMDSNNETINIISPASISNVSLSGGGSDIYFNRLLGAPSVTGTITISTTNYSKIITIFATGVASSN